MAPGAWYGRGWALGYAAAALLSALFMWGFTVDDALVSVRYAHHLATGVGYRFDASGPSTDGVTPLLWAPVLAPFAVTDDALVVLERAKVLGVVVWVAAAGALGHRIAGVVRRRAHPTVRALVGLVVLGLAFPIGAWAASGMETGVATALATAAAVRFHRPREAAVLAGFAAAFRPELVVWAAVLATGAGLTARRSWVGVGRAVSLAAAPFALSAVVRQIAFGSVAPLALTAKPSDPSHGLLYAGAAAVVTLTPLLAFAPLALAKRTRSASDEGAPPDLDDLHAARAIALAAASHLIVVVAVGGDWMPYARLLVPIAPSLLLVFAALPDTRLGHALLVVRGAVTLLLGAVLFARTAPAGRSVHPDRADLVHRARPALAHARVVATLDIGWVSAATDARIVDLAGLTDPAIATLPGGHTSKAVDLGMLLERNVDTVLVYSSPRLVERRIVGHPLFQERFDRVLDLRLGDAGASYAIYRRR